MMVVRRRNAGQKILSMATSKWFDFLISLEISLEKIIVEMQELTSFEIFSKPAKIFWIFWKFICEFINAHLLHFRDPCNDPAYLGPTVYAYRHNLFHIFIHIYI